MEMIDKAAVVAEINRRISEYENCGIDNTAINAKIIALQSLLIYINTLEVRDPYERCVQYQSVEDGIRVHAETYSFNIDSELFPQLTKEQQKLWRKEIEYACLSGGDMGYILAKDPRYKENHEVKEVDLEKELDSMITPELKFHKALPSLFDVAKHFFELGIKSSQRGEKV